MPLALASGWVIGWVIGALVVVIAAVLLLTIIGLGRRIVRQAEDITAALDGGRTNTDELFELPRVNLALDRIVRDLRTVREGQAR